MRVGPPSRHPLLREQMACRRRAAAALALLTWVSGTLAVPVNVELHTKWPSSPAWPMLEAAEYLAQHHPASFWPFMASAQGTAASSAQSEKAALSAAMARVKELLGPQDAAVCQAHVESRSMAPAVEVTRQLALPGNTPCGGDAEAWTQVLSVALCDEKALRAALTHLPAASSSELEEKLDEEAGAEIMAPVEAYPFDAIHPRSAPRASSGASSTSRLVVVYGLPGSARFAAMHRVVEEALAGREGGEELEYVARAVAAPASYQLPTRVPGFGVALDIKNMEYRALDDRAVAEEDEEDEEGEDSAAGSEEEEDEEEEVAGILFSRLASRYPALGPRLEVARKELAAREAEAKEEDLKVWDMKDLGLQATQYALAGSTGPRRLRRLQRIAQDFPKHARGLSRMRVEKSLRRSVRRLRETTGDEGDVVTVNGRDVGATGAELALPQLLDTVRQEVAMAARLNASGVAPSVLRPLQARAAEHAAQEEGVETRVDVRAEARGAVWFMNNIEKDSRYSKWPKPLQALLQHAFQLIPVRRNLYTAVFGVDPASEEGVASLRTAFEQVDKNSPIRWGVVPDARCLRDAFAQAATPRAQAAVEGARAKACPARDLAVALAAAKTLHGADAAREMLRELGSRTVQAPSEGEGGDEAVAAEARGRVVASYAAGVSRASGAWTEGSFRDELQRVLLRAEGGKGCEEGEEEPGCGEEVAAAAEAALERAAAYTTGKNLPHGFATVNGLLLEGSVREQAVAASMLEMRALQQLVYGGQLRDSANVLKDLLRRHRAVSRLHPVIRAAPSARTLVPAAAADVAASGRAWLEATEAGSGSSGQAPLSFVVVADVGEATGAELAWTALAHVQGGPSRGGRVTIAQNPTRVASSDAAELGAAEVAAAVWASVWPLVGGPHSDAATAYLRWVAEQTMARGDTTTSGSSSSSGTQLLHDLRAGIALATDDGDGKARAALAAVCEDAALKRAWAALAEGSDPHSAGAAMRREAGLERGQAAVIANGHVVPVGEGALAVTGADFELLEQVHEPLAKRIARAVRNSVSGPGAVADAVLTLAASLGEYARHPRKFMRAERGAGAALTVTGGAEAEDAPVTVHAVLDPLSEGAQRASAVVRYLTAAPLGAVVRVVVTLRPRLEVGDFPVRRFYRWAATPRVAFHRLPTQHVLTMMLEAPEPWIVQKAKAGVDLDNMQLSALPAGTRHLAVTWELSSLTVTGSCDDRTSGQPPNGLQLELVPASQVGRASGTLVMQNLGYYQLQAAPGVWDLQLAPGRGAALFSLLDTLEHVQAARRAGLAESGVVEVEEAWNGVPSLPSDAAAYSEPVQQRRVVVRSFAGASVFLPVRKQRGRENVPLLAGEGQDGGDDSLWASVSGFFGRDGADGGAAAGEANNTVHVFSLASGHLYERFMKIMMLSVSRRTSRPVKFWLVENFLSPAFKAVLPKLAAEFGYQYELVTYKWPSWLRRQTEQQRIIWGYKILFLDVLFPLHLKKVITIDADQVLRGDLAELWDLDLQGHAYAYTPFCKSNKETLGFQFWNSGFWAEHLRGRPYHISALNVVDLAHFRQRAVGDRLRAIYDQLSRDPGSLSNLDQDLPNYAQHMVPIYSLPLKWLWCESWCDHQSKEEAMTIDLCNNPMHKEPKLDMARRIVTKDYFPESWDELDETVRAAEERIAAEEGA